jgi:hypothetical protein
MARVATESIRFTRRVQAPPAAGAAGEAAALVRATPGVVRPTWQPGRAATPEPVVRVSPETFHNILQVSADPVVIRERSRGWLVRRMQFTTQYQGYYFTTRAAEEELRMPPGAMVVFAERVEFR